MELHYQKDIKEEVYRIINTDDFSLSALNDIIMKFFQDMDFDFRAKVLQTLCVSNFNIVGFENKENVLDIFTDVYNSSIIANEQKRIIMRSIAETIADCSDDEAYCDNKIYVIIKNLSDDTSELIQDYDSWEEAETKVDDWYTGCCDDVFMAENMLFPILCSIREREYDYCLNFCTVIEFNAMGLDDARDAWENAWENGEC